MLVLTPVTPICHIGITGLVSNSNWHAVLFLTDITDIRHGVNSLLFSNGSSLSLHDSTHYLGIRHTKYFQKTPQVPPFQ